MVLRTVCGLPVLQPGLYNHNTGWNSPTVPPVQELEGVIKLGFWQFLKPLFSLSIHLLLTIELPSLIAGKL